MSKKFPPPFEKLAELSPEETWLITWRANSDYVGQRPSLKLPSGHTETFILKGGSPEDWVQNNPEKSVVFCYKIQ